MSRCLLSTILRVLPNTLLTSSRAFSCSKCFLINYYETLKVSPNATAKEIKEAYFKLSKENHPDLHPNDPTCHEKFIQLQQAYQVLSNAASRKEYDMRNHNQKPSYQTSRRPYTDPNSASYDEWFGKQTGRAREARWKTDDPRNFYSYYGRPRNMTPEEMRIFKKRQEYAKYESMRHVATFFIVSMLIITMGETIFFKQTREEQMNELMMKRAKLLESIRDPYFNDPSFWDERDRQKLAQIERDTLREE